MFPQLIPDRKKLFDVAIRLFIAAATYLGTKILIDFGRSGLPYAFYGLPYEHGFESFSCYVWNPHNVSALAILAATPVLFSNIRLVLLAPAAILSAIFTAFIAHLPFLALYELDHARTCSERWLFPAILVAQTLPLLSYIALNAGSVRKKFTSFILSCLALAISAPALSYASFHSLIDAGDHAHFHASFHIFLFSLPALAIAAASAHCPSKTNLAWAAGSTFALLASASFGYYLFVLPTIALLPWIAPNFGSLLLTFSETAARGAKTLSK